MSDADYHRRTAITRLDVPLIDESLLRDTIEAWKRCHSKSDVQQLNYDDVLVHD